MKRAKSLIPLVFLSACHMVEEGVPAEESSSGFTDAEETFDPSASTPATTAGSSATATSSPSTSATTEDEGSSSSGDPTFGDDATTTHGEESSTGEGVSDYALAFDGSSRGQTSAGIYDWSETDFTVEAWVQIKDLDATGIIIDTANVEFTGGWVLYLHNDFHALVFSFFDVPGSNNVVIGSSVEEIGVGWHHFAATKLGNSVTIHVDGVTAATQGVPATVAFDSDASWILGGAPNEDLDFNLKDASVDDVRVTGSALYQADFDPPMTYGDDPAILKLLFDEGQGSTASDDENEVVFTVENPTWIPGPE